MTLPGSHVIGGGAAKSDAQAQVAAAAPDARKLPETVDQMKSKAYQAMKIGYTSDAIIMLKDSEEMRHWRITSVKDDTIDLTEVSDGEDREALTIDIDDMLNEYRLYKGKLTEKVHIKDEWLPSHSAAWGYEMVKGAVAIALYELYEKHKADLSNVDIFQNPLGLRANKTIKAKTLHLVPATMRIERKASVGALTVGTFDLVSSGKSESVYLCGHFVIPKKDSGPNVVPWVTPFWAVQPPRQANETPNLELTSVKQSIGHVCITIPMLVNTVEVETGCELTWLKPKKGVVELSDPDDKKKKKVKVAISAEKEPPVKKGRKGK